MPREGAAGDDLIGQAAAWLIALDCGTADEAAFEAWRAASPRHASAFAQVAATWSRTADSRVARGIAISVEHEARRNAAQAMAQDAAEAIPAPRVTRRSALAAGLTALAVLGGAGAWLAYPQRVYASTGVGERRRLALPDGSAIWLNTDSRLAWHVGDERRVWLEHGEAALEVAPGRRPLHLQSAAIDAALSPGRFNMRLLADGGELLVLDGSAEALSRRVPKGDALVVHGPHATLSPLSDMARANASAWQDGRIVFNGMTLAQAVAEYNRYLPEKLVVADPALGALRLGGEFRVDDVRGFLLALDQGFGVMHHRGEGGILLNRAVAGSSPTDRDAVGQ